MRLLITAAILIFSIPVAQARNHHHHARHYYHGQRYSHAEASEYRGAIVTVQTEAGPIRVASHLAPRFKALISDFVAHGYRPRHVGCFATGGHVRYSRHYAGAACDFDQRGWGLSTSFMYHAHAIIHRHGLRDGCFFRHSDCGHVDDGHILGYGYRRWRHYDFDF